MMIPVNRFPVNLFKMVRQLILPLDVLFLFTYMFAAVLRVGNKDTMEYNKYLVGVELNDTDAKVSIYSIYFCHISISLTSIVFTENDIMSASRCLSNTAG